MSRIGKSPVTIPEGVSVDIRDGLITVKGKLGELSQNFKDIRVRTEDGQVILERPSEKKEHKAKHGLYRSLIRNMIEGVSKGYTKKLEMVGVGYRATHQGQKLELGVGYSHNIVINLAPEIKVETKAERGQNPVIALTSHDKQLVGQVASKIRSLRKPEPYKGKGIRYVGEQVRRKTGKSA